MLRRAAIFIAFAVAGAILAAAAMAQSRAAGADRISSITAHSAGAPAAAQVQGRAPIAIVAEKAPASQQAMLKAQNDARAKLGLEPLAWSSDLQKASEGVIDGITGGLCTSSIVRKAVNPALDGLYWSSPSRTNDGGLKVQDISPAFVVSEWRDRSAKRTGCAKDADCNAFALLTRPVNRKVGCATAICPNQAKVWICRYSG